MRIASRMILAAVVGSAIGCGGGAEAPAPSSSAKNTPDASNTTPVPTQPQPTQDPPKGTAAKTDPTTTQPIAPPPMTPAGWELDPTKHAIPTGPATGTLAGVAFTPEVQYEGDTLSFRVHKKDGSPDRQITLRFAPEKAKAAAQGFKLTVRPDQTPGADVPVVMTDFPPPKPGASGVFEFANGYALTLELGKRDKDKLPGKIYLSLPDDGKDFLAGTFTAEWVRPTSVPPGPDDAPFVQGKVTVTGTENPKVRVGYAGQTNPDDFVSDMVAMPLAGPNPWARSDFHKPRATILIGAEGAGQPGRYEHTRLTPGRYLVYAATENGPIAWKWVSVTADSQQTADLALDSSKTGSLTVKVPADTPGKVQLAPADESGQPLPSALFTGLAFSLNLEADVKDGTAKFEKLGPGKYEVHAGPLTGTVEVKPGAPATIELMPKK